MLCCCILSFCVYCWLWFLPFKVMHRVIPLTRFYKLLTTVTILTWRHVPQVPQWHDAPGSDIIVWSQEWYRYMWGGTSPLPSPSFPSPLFPLPSPSSIPWLEPLALTLLSGHRNGTDTQCAQMCYNPFRCNTLTQTNMWNQETYIWYPQVPDCYYEWNKHPRQVKLFLDTIPPGVPHVFSV